MIRYLVGIVLGGVVTIGLFFIMHGLIKLGRVELSDQESVRLLDFVRAKQDANLQTKKRELPKKQKAEKQPNAPDMKMPQSMSGSGKVDAVSIGTAPPETPSKVRISGGPSLGGVISDADVIPLVRIQPMYPRAAAQREIEGWVMIEFDISTTGAVVNPQVVEANPPNIFNQAALQAIRKWKYKPRVKDGVPIVTRGVTVRLTFRLEDM